LLKETQDSAGSSKSSEELYKRLERGKSLMGEIRVLVGTMQNRI